MQSSRRSSLVLVLVLAAACGKARPDAVTRTSQLRRAAVPVPPDRPLLMRAPADSTLRNDPFSLSVRRGRALLRATRDSLPRNVGNSLRCVSCHLDDGTRAYAMPWVGVYGSFPQYRSRSGRVSRLEDRVNDCFRRSLNGQPLAIDGDDMRDIVAYMSWLSRGTPSGRREPGSGIDSIGPLASDTTKGRVDFLMNCARCHGVSGGGMNSGDATTSGPPLWGPQSFTVGAGMARLQVTAAFIRRNMPFDLAGIVDVQTSYDVAGYIATRARPDFAGKELDWPNGDAPPDAAYATRAQHKR